MRLNSPRRQPDSAGWVLPSVPALPLSSDGTNDQHRRQPSSRHKPVPWGLFIIFITLKLNVSVRRSTWLTDADRFGIEVRARAFSRWSYDSGHASYLAVG